MKRLRKQIEDEIIEFMDTLDPSGANSDRMRSLFNGFTSDKAALEWFKAFFEDLDRNFTLSYKPYDNPVNMEFISKVAKKYEIPLYETVYMPYLSDDPENPVGTVCKIMVLDYPIKRLKQMVYKKSHASISASKRNAETGQVINEDKTARVTDNEVYSFIVQNQYNAAKEFFGLRSDDLVAQNEAQRKIIRDGDLSLDDVSDSPINKVTMNTINYYMLGCCLTTNLISKNGYLLPATLKKKDFDKRKIERE